MGETWDWGSCPYLRLIPASEVDVVAEEVRVVLLLHLCFQQLQQVRKPLKGMCVPAQPVEVDLRGGQTVKQIICCSAIQSCPTLCNPMDCSMPGFTVLHHLLDFAQTHVHWVDDAIQPLYIYFIFKLKYSWCIVLYKSQVYSRVINNSKGYTPFIIIINHWLYSPCCISL